MESQTVPALSTPHALSPRKGAFLLPLKVEKGHRPAHSR